MFEELKESIRKDISNEKVTDINSSIARQLRNRAETALNNKHFDEYIACYEIIAEDLEEYENSIGNIPKDESSAVVAFQDVLVKYSDCGYGNCADVLNLAKRCRKDMDDIIGSDAMWGPIDMSLTDSMCAVDINTYFNDIERIARRDLQIANRNYSQLPNESMSKVTVTLALRTLMKAYIYKERYKDAIDIYYDDNIPDELTDLIQKSLALTVEAYQISESGIFNESEIGKVIGYLKSYAEKECPEANWILGIMSAEGYRMPVDIAMAKDYFKKGNEYAEKLKGTIGYTDFDFKVLSPISQDEIILKAQKGIYQSKFYKAKSAIKQSPVQNTVSSTNIDSSANTSSDGCYVATCVYGSYDCPQVWTLRRFRDDTLRQSFLGNLFVKCYYGVSPTAVKLFGNYKWFHKLFKSPLDKLVNKLNKKGVDNTPYYDR